MKSTKAQFRKQDRKLPFVKHQELDLDETNLVLEEQICMDKISLFRY